MSDENTMTIIGFSKQKCELNDYLNDIEIRGLSFDKFLEDVSKNNKLKRFEKKIKATCGFDLRVMAMYEYNKRAKIKNVANGYSRYYPKYSGDLNVYSVCMCIKDENTVTEIRNDIVNAITYLYGQTQNYFLVVEDIPISMVIQKYMDIFNVGFLSNTYINDLLMDNRIELGLFDDCENYVETF